MSFLDSLNAVASTENPYGVSILKDTAASLAAPVITTDNPRVDQSAMSVTCVLTSANPDRQGDIINPQGGDFSEHETNPVVMFHHGKQHKLPIGKAEDRDGNYTVRHVKSPSGNDILIGTTHFAQSNQFAQDVFGLVAEDVLRGVSIGFDPPELESEVDILGPSPSLDRNAMHFKSWKLLEYSHTPIGVNRDALTVKIEKALEGSVKMHRFLLKALQPFAHPRKTVVAVTAPAHKKAASCATMPPKQRAAVAIAKATPKGKKKPATKGYETSVNESVGHPSSVPVCPACGGTGAFATRDTPYGYECQSCGGGYGLDDKHEKKGWPAFRVKGAIAVVKALDPTAFIRWKPVRKAMDDEDEDGIPDDVDTSDDTTGDSGVGAVDADLPPEDAVDPNAMPEDVPGDDMDGPTPAVKSYYDASQGLLDLAMMFEQGMKKSEHSKARKNASKMIADLRKVAAECKQFGDKVQDEMDKMPVAGEEEPPPDDETDTEANPDDLETEEDGALVTKNYTPRRLTFGDLAGNAVVATRPAPSDSALASQVKSLERQLKSRDKAIAERDAALNEMTDTLEAVARRNR